MEDWKNTVGVMASRLPKFLATPGAEHMPDAPAEPNLKVCMVIDGILTIPADVRNMFIRDPVRAPEWRELLTKFDREYGTPVAVAPKPESKKDVPEPDVPKLAAIFPDEPTNIKDFEAKYAAPASTFTNDATTAFRVVEGPKLFVVSTGDGQLADTKPIITHGAGKWLTDNEAKTYSKEHPGKGHICQFEGDQSLVVLEVALQLGLGTLPFDRNCNPTAAKQQSLLGLTSSHEAN